jgi:hypothetical protein
MEINKEITKFISDAPLYKKIETSLELYGPSDIQGCTFNSFCEHEKENQTFELEVYPESAMFLANSLSERPFFVPSGQTIEPKKVNYTQHYRAKCKSCKIYYRDIIINIFTETPYSHVRREGENRPKFYLRKIGQYPPFEIVPDREVLKYLKPEDESNYKKALICLSNSYGIGSYAYLRRIIQNEIIGLIKDISELEFDGVSQVKGAYENYMKDSQMAKLIDILNKHLPQSFKELGDNPIRLLYSQLSGGIHEFSDEECLEKASSIDVLINYVVKKIYDEKFHLKEVKNAVSKLNKNNN